MSKSYHVTRKDLKGKTKQELDAMANDPDSILHKWAEKRGVKRAVRRQRRDERLLQNSSKLRNTLV